MPKLNDLGKKERTEICRTLARAAHDCLANSKDADGCILGGTFDARVFKAWSELGVVEDDEFYGNSFSKERIEVLKGFEKIYEDALLIGAQYDECIAPLAEVSANFAMKSEVLVRMSCISRFSATLLGDGPFATLHVTLCVAEDDDHQSIANDEEGEATSSDDGDESDDSIIASSSEENDDSDDSGSEEGEEEEEEKTSDIEEVTPEEAEQVDGPRRKKVRVKKEEDALESDADAVSAVEDEDD